MGHFGHRRYHIITLYIEIIPDVEKTYFSPHTGGTAGAIFNVSPRARNRFNQVVEAKRFEGVFLYRKVC